MKLHVLAATYNLGDIAVIKSLLESEDIDFLAHGENFNLIRPWVQPVRFMVAEDMLERAKVLIDSLNLTYSPLSLLSSGNELEDENGLQGIDSR